MRVDFTVYIFYGYLFYVKTKQEQNLIMNLNLLFWANLKNIKFFDKIEKKKVNFYWKINTPLLTT